MNPTLEAIARYLVLVAPGIIAGAIMLIVARRESRLRILIYLAMFILLRDALTPIKLWSLGTQGFFWMRLYSDPMFLYAFGIGCLGLSLSLYFLDRENQPLVRWTRGNAAIGVLWSVAAAVVVVAPLMMLYRYTPIELRGGSVLAKNIPAILVFAILGNLLEELLFRGYVFGLLVQKMTPLRAGVLSGVVFAFCHIFLATTVTNVGYPLLIVTLWEGTIVGIVGAKFGVGPATISHGGAVFLLSSGLI